MAECPRVPRLEQQRPDHFLTQGITGRTPSADLLDRNRTKFVIVSGQQWRLRIYLDKLLGGFGLFVAFVHNQDDNNKNNNGRS